MVINDVNSISKKDDHIINVKQAVRKPLRPPNLLLHRSKSSICAN